MYRLVAARPISDLRSSGSFSLARLFVAQRGVRVNAHLPQLTKAIIMNVFVGKREARTMDGLATPLANGMEVSIIPAISGG